MPANKKISQLPEAFAPVAESSYVIIVDENGQNKRVALSNLPSSGGGGGGGGATNLNGLSDVVINSPQSGDVLVYDPAEGEISAFKNIGTLNGGFFN